MKPLLPLAITTSLCLSGTTLAQDGRVSSTEFNPAISLILDGRHTDLDQRELYLPGFQLGGEAGLPEQGFSSGHNELSISANIDDKFYGSMTTALIYSHGETEVELEDAYIETLGLGHGLTVKGGRFMSGIGYLNSTHSHAHDFADRPLVYDALLGGHLIDTGLQASWIAPTDFYLKLGAEITRGSEYPSGDNSDNNQGRSLFIKTGGDIGDSHSWQLGASHYRSSFDERIPGGHHHGHEEAQTLHNALHNGEVKINAIDFVYKWAPLGNARDTNVKFQAEYFIRDEQAAAEFEEGANSAEADYHGQQQGFYVQAVYQFMPSWRIGARYDRLSADNRIRNFVDNGIDSAEFLDESGLGTAGDPKRHSLMLDYAPSHFSRICLQYSQLDNGAAEKNDQITLQYVMSLGSHGAHNF